MKHAFRDARIWLPAALAAVAFAMRAQPLPPAAPAMDAQSLALPAVHGAAPPKGAADYELDASDSSVRFLVHGDRGELLVACEGIAGEMHLEAGGHAGTLSLRFDLAALRALTPQGDLDVQHVLGVHRCVLVYHARLIADATSDLPGVSRQTWLGTLTFGSTRRRQLIETWYCRLPGRPWRSCGQGTVAAAAFGLPPRHRLGIVAEQNDVTMGLDLAWRRRRE